MYLEQFLAVLAVVITVWAIGSVAVFASVYRATQRMRNQIEVNAREIDLDVEDVKRSIARGARRGDARFKL